MIVMPAADKTVDICLESVRMYVMDTIELSEALRDINPDEYMQALGIVYNRQSDMGLALEMFDTFRKEYPALAAAGTMAIVHCEHRGTSVAEKAAMATGALASVMALREMLDIKALNEIPTVGEQ